MKTMKTKDQPQVTRRQWMGVAGRWSLVGLLGGGCGWLALREHEPCDNHFRCAGCTALGRCGLPEAVVYKTYQKAESDESI